MEYKDIMRSIPKNVKYEANVRIVCAYKGKTFTVSMPIDGKYGFVHNGKKWNRVYDGKLKDHLEDILKKHDKELDLQDIEKDRNSELSTSLGKLLKPYERPTGDIFIVAHTTIKRDKKTNRWQAHMDRNHKTTHVRPLTLIDRLVSFEADECAKMVATSRGAAAKKMAHYLKKRKERIADVETVRSILNAVQTERQTYKKGTHFWAFGRTSVYLDTYRCKMLLFGEWMLPMKGLLKLAENIPSIAKKLADPNTKFKGS